MSTPEKDKSDHESEDSGVSKKRQRTPGHRFSDKLYYEKLREKGIKTISFRMSKEELDLFDSVVEKEKASDPNANRLSVLRNALVEKGQGTPELKKYLKSVS